MHLPVGGHLGCFCILVLLGPQWTLRCMCSFKLIFLGSWSRCQEVESPNYMKVQIFLFVFPRNLVLFSVEAKSGTHEGGVRVASFTHTRQHWMFIRCFGISHSSCRWWFIVVSVCISPLINDSEHFFMCLLPSVYVLTSKCLFISPHFLLELLGFLLLSFVNSLYILAINPLFDVWYATTFSHLVGCLLILACFF